MSSNPDPAAEAKPSPVEAGTLYLVGTPIGNLGDITFRAAEVLGAVTVIACEDTRHSLRLLDRIGVRAPLLSLHQHNEARRSQELIGRLKAGDSAAYISDAGMPSISDPGARLVRACAAEGVPVCVIPGPSAVIAALAGAGFGGDTFFFGGFLPNKSGGREREVLAALERKFPSAFFESPHRIAKTLAAIAAADPGRPVCVAREITKKFEEFYRGTAAEAAARFAGGAKGEITLVISGR
ncbi:MAG: 16S rRNA (cytidine(1402)-2'-O)-methyltransferase [Verrucomicrobiales bacterium]